jgi:DNA-binding NarL/FixJ family response regulator
MMKVSAQVLIVSGSPIIAQALQGLLLEAPVPWQSQAITDLEAREPQTTREAGILLLAPQHWEEFLSWLPGLRREFARHPWLLLAEPRLAGMFLPYLESQPCALVPLGAAPEELWSRMGGLMDARGACLRHELLARFSPGRPVRGGSGRLQMPTPAELQCGCAVSMGLGNRQIAALLHLAETTVKSHVHHLLRKLHLHNRMELGGYVQHVLTPRSLSSIPAGTEAARERPRPAQRESSWA